ncbi:MAG: FRG domain-containing protein [Treponema sp.]|nr:FRG domain-containing protein [Treponema sp.]
MSDCDEVYGKSVRVKGFGFSTSEESLWKKRLECGGEFSLPSGERNRAQGLFTMADGVKVQPAVAESLSEYVEAVADAYSDMEKNSLYKLKQIYWRGFTNANYVPVPPGLRESKPELEHVLLEEFMRRYPQETDSCTNAMRKLTFMQHYELPTRLLDISEDPLVAMLFACTKAKTAIGVPEDNEFSWGCVELYGEPDEEPAWNDSAAAPDSMKYEKSLTVSIIANTAFMKREFPLKKLGMAVQNDGNLAMKIKLVHLKDVVSRSVIVRTSRSNERIANQSGLFIAVNANEICAVNRNKGADVSSVDAEKLTEHIISSADEDISLCSLKKNSPYSSALKDSSSWDIVFRKVEPYSMDNKVEKFRSDPFGLNRLMFKDTRGIRRQILIPPSAKKRIARELANFGITEDFVYPEKNSVSYVLTKKAEKRMDAGNP